MPNLDKLQPIADRVIDQAFGAGLSTLDEPDRVFFLAWCYSVIVDNGGFLAFFCNSPADSYSETLEALRQLGLTPFADLLVRAAGFLFAGDVPRSMEQRNAIIRQLLNNMGIDEQFEELGRHFSDEGGGDHVFEVLEQWYFEHKPQSQGGSAVEQK